MPASVWSVSYCQATHVCVLLAVLFLWAIEQVAWVHSSSGNEACYGAFNVTDATSLWTALVGAVVVVGVVFGKFNDDVTESSVRGNKTPVGVSVLSWILSVVRRQRRDVASGYTHTIESPFKILFCDILGSWLRCSDRLDVMCTCSIGCRCNRRSRLGLPWDEREPTTLAI